MSFLSDVYKLFGDGVDVIRGFSIVNFDGQAIYIEGITRILEVNIVNIKLATKHNVIEILGKQLYIQQSNKNSISIKGDITAIIKS
ncbi:MAG: YabP/YqfC family sporulation protein [Clostridiales bacterium]|jgi:D-alanyl-D-alanine dipeptidase|nr:YabP/YqfC family sporulation protein [Clostridiales bacterium]